MTNTVCAFACFLLLCVAGCDGTADPDGGGSDGGGMVERDAGPDLDGGPDFDAGTRDAGPPPTCDGVTCSGHGTCVETGSSIRCECDDGFVPSGLACVEPVVPSTGDLFVDLPDTGFVVGTAHPLDTAPTGSPVMVSFGVPFPRGTVAEVGQIRVTDDAGAELPAHVVELTRWRSLAGDASFVESVRAALVQVSLTFATREPRALQIHWGAAPSASGPDGGDAWADWPPIGASSFFPDEYPASEGLREPRVYVTFPPDWLGACILRTRTEPIGTDAAWGWFDDAYPEFARTGVNDVDPRVTADNRIDYVGEYEPWLFDRTLTLFGVYVRTGELAWLRHAHRAAQFYAAHVTSAGYFDLTDGDLKYAYGGPMLIDLMLTGDRRHLPRIEAVASAGESWDEEYTSDTGFWTERHQTYALLAAVSAFEATGDAAHAARARAIAAATFRLAREPFGGEPAQGCVLHTRDSHEGDGEATPICSPWMAALLAEAVFRYYVHSEDRAALEFLAGLGDFVATYGTAEEGGGLVPYYLASSAQQDSPDLEHACDVAGLVARAAWARGALGGDPDALAATRDGLLTSCEANLGDWHRPGGPEAGLSEWRLSPPRKLNWWFGTTLDLPWL